MGDNMDKAEIAHEIVELRKETGMSRKEFCVYFEIPYSTLTDWELGKKKMPDYVLRLLQYKAGMEKLIKKSAALEEGGQPQEEKQ